MTGMGSRMRRHGVLSLVMLAVAALVLSASGAADFAFPLQPNSVRLAVIGDMGTGEQPQMDVAQQMVKSRARFPFEFVITLGDNIYTGSLPADFEKAFAVPYKPLLDAGVPFYATLGNHDKTNERFYKPFNMNGANYYAFKKGNVRFFALDSNYVDRKQTAWIESQLRDAGNWRLEDLLLPSSALLLGPVPRSGHRPAEGARTSVRQATAWMSCCPAMTTYRAGASAAGHLLLRRGGLRLAARRQSDAHGHHGEGIRHRSLVHADRNRRR